MAKQKKVTILDLQAKKTKGERFTMVTAYDYPTAQIAEEAGMDVILVGDSLAMVVLGLPNTVSVTVDEMLHHARAVARGAQFPLLVGDMPFMSYTNMAEAIHNAGRFLKEANMDVVKMEGGARVAPNRPSHCHRWYSSDGPYRSHPTNYFPTGGLSGARKKCSCHPSSD